MRVRINFLLILLMIFSLVGSLLITFTIYDVMMYSIILNYFIALIIVNNNNYNYNLINMQTVFLAGFGVFILGRFFGVLLNPDLTKYLYCIDFVFNYCANHYDTLYLNFIINIILIFFSLSFCVVKEPVFKSENLKLRNIGLFYFISFFFIILNFYFSVESIYKALSFGYMALYASQAEAYQSPYAVLVSSIASASLAFLYSIKNRVSKKFLITMIVLYIIPLLLSILTGSRSGFIAGLILFLWFFCKNKKINFRKIIIFAPLVFLLIFSLDKIASLSGAREFSSANDISFIENISNVFFSQGISLMVFNTSINIENYPLLGFLKTIFPGVQFFYGFFGIDKRYEFDWSSYMTYKENRVAYYDGYGLGWSIFSDFYILSFGFIPLFCLLIYFFGKFMVFIQSKNTIFNRGIIFISMIYFFAISRGSISPYIFTIIIYIVFCIYYGVLGFKRRKQ